MALTKEDKKDVRDIVRDTVIEAIEQLMLPRFDEHDLRFNAIEQSVTELKEDVRVLKTDVRQVKSTLIISTVELKHWKTT